MVLLTFVVTTTRTREGLFSTLIGEGSGSKNLRIFLPFTVLAPFLLVAVGYYAMFWGWLPVSSAAALSASFIAPHLDHEIARSSRYQQPPSVLLIDLDHFKHINDTYGHRMGDEALSHIGSVLTKASRPSDVAVRYGGEEMVLVASNTDQHGAHVLAERLPQLIADGEILTTTRGIVPVTASIGVASLQHDDTAVTLIARADSALYAGKGDGRNCVRPIPTEGTVVLAPIDGLPSEFVSLSRPSKTLFHGREIISHCQS